MKKLITIVIPSYNVEKTLEKTLESLILQDENKRDRIEILVVNDGSSDNTEGVARKYAQKYSQIIRVINKMNGGHGSTINCGVSEARGKYFRVIDGDDWVDTNNFEQFIDILEQTDADIVCSDYYCYSQKTGTLHKVKSGEINYNYLYKFSEIYLKYNFSMHAVTVKTELLKRQNIKLDEHCFYVDVEFEMLLTQNAQTVLYVDLLVYIYRIDQMNQSVSMNGWLIHNQDQLKVIKTMMNYLKEYRIGDQYEKEKEFYFKKRLKASCMGRYKIGLYFKRVEQKEFVEQLKSYDLWLYEQDAVFYKEMNRNFFIRICRLSKFCAILYYIAGMILQIRKKIKTYMIVYKLSIQR